MIRTERGETMIMADSRGEIFADFCCIVESLKKFFMEDEGKTKEQAKEEVMEMVEVAFSVEEDSDKSDELKEMLGEILGLLKGGKADE